MILQKKHDFNNIGYNKDMSRRKPDRFKLLLQLISITLLLLLCGCASLSYWTWQHPNIQSELQLLKDRKECRELARTEVVQINYYYSFYNMGQRYDFPSYYYDQYRSPFFHGYHHYLFMQQQEDLERFFLICMKAKGWQQVKVNPESSKTSKP